MDASAPPTEPPTPSTNSKFPHVPVNGVNGDAHELSPTEKTTHSRRQSKSQPSAAPLASEKQGSTESANGSPDSRLAALTREREALLDEVSQVRKALEDFQRKHDAEISGLQERLSQTETERDEKGNQYQSLLGKVNTIKSQLGERLKADAVSHVGSKSLDSC